MSSMTAPVLYLICCGAPPAKYADQAVDQAQQRGWQVCVMTTEYGRRFANVRQLEQLTGHPVRSEYKQPEEPDLLPPPDAIVIAPATVNTINKWGAGICDTVALGYLCEGIGLGLPLVAIPYSNRAHTSHPKFQENIEVLRSWGVTVLWGADVLPVHEPGRGVPERFPWHLALDVLEDTHSSQ
jgi:flavoprotein